MVPFAEGALGVADELCVDIHLVQCAHCREELEELTDLAALFSAELEHPDPRNQLRDLLDRLEHLPEPKPVSLDTSRWYGFMRGTLLPLSVACALSLMILFGGGLGWTQGRVPYFDLPTAEAMTGLPLSSAWRPWMRGTGPLADMEQLEILLYPAISQGPF